MRIRTKLLVPFLVLPLAPLALLGWNAYDTGRRSIEASLGRLFEVEAARSIEALDREVYALFHTGETWASLDLMQDVLTDDIDGRISSFLVGQARTQETLGRALVADAAGRVVAASHPEWLGSVVPVRAPVEAGNEREACGDDPSLPPAAGAAAGSATMCSFRIHAHFDEGQVIGTLSVSWDLVRLFERVQAEYRLAPGQGDLVLLRRDGLVVWAPPRHRDWRLRHNLVAAGSRAAALAVAGRRGFLVEPLATQGHLVGYAHSAGASGWSALVVEDTRTAFAPVDPLRGAVLGVGTLMAVLALVLSIVLSARLTRPLRQLETAVRRVEGGDLDLRVESGSGDEIGTLSRSFDRMVQELKRQRAQLVDKEYVDSLIAGMADGLFVVDAAGHVQQTNPAFLRLLGRGAEDVVGRPACALFAGGEGAFRPSVLEPARRGGSAREVELELAAPDGGPGVPVLVSAGLLSASGGRAGPEVVCIATDITQRKLTEEQLRRAREDAEAAARAKAEFLATVSHEVRTPLHGVIGMTDLLEETSLTDRQRDYVATARRSGEALLAVFDDILDYSKMDAGRLKLERVAFELRDCVESAVEVLTGPARDKGLELSVQVDEALARRVVGDPNRLRQVLLNLGGNAVKFTDAGAVAIRVAGLEGSASSVRFTVTDTGIGLSPTTLERLFEPFYQADSSSTRRHGGTGLGLAIARQLVELMNGRVEVESEEGRGSSFSFTAELPSVAEERQPVTVRRGALEGLRVLIVDDNATNRQVLREMLRAWKCVPEEAADAWEGLEKLRGAAGTPGAFQLALVDFQMPEMDGGEMARQIKADDRFASLPLLLLTSMPQHGEAARMMGLGFAAYLTKPVRQTQLLETIAEVMGATVAPHRPSHLALLKRKKRDTGGPKRR